MNDQLIQSVHEQLKNNDHAIMPYVAVPSNQELKQIKKMFKREPSELKRMFQALATIDRYLTEDGLKSTIVNGGIKEHVGSVRKDLPMNSTLIQYTFAGIVVGFQHEDFILSFCIGRLGLHLERIYVAKDKRGKGLGKMLMNIILDAMDENRVSLSTIPTDLKDDSIEGVDSYLGFIRDFYVKRGFVKLKMWEGIIYKYS